MLEGTIYQPQSGKAQFSYRYNTYHDSGSSTPVLAISSGMYGTDQATAKTGFQLKKSSGTNITMREVIIDAIITLTISLFVISILMIPFFLLGMINL